MKDSLNKRSKLLNERLMKKWGYLAETMDTSSYNRDQEEIIVEEDPDTPQNVATPQIEEPEVSGPDEFAENSVLHRMIYELSQKHNISLTEEQFRRIEEGMMDKFKARTSGMIGKIMGKDKGGQDFRKVDSLVKGKLKKIQKLKSDILSDMGAMDLPMETADKISQVFAQLGTELGAITARDHTGKKISSQVAQKTLAAPAGGETDVEKFAHPDDISAKSPPPAEEKPEMAAGKSATQVKADVAKRTDLEAAAEAGQTQTQQLATLTAMAQAEKAAREKTAKDDEGEKGGGVPADEISLNRTFQDKTGKGTGRLDPKDITDPIGSADVDAIKPSQEPRKKKSKKKKAKTAPKKKAGAPPKKKAVPKSQMPRTTKQKPTASSVNTKTGGK